MTYRLPALLLNLLFYIGWSGFAVAQAPKLTKFLKKDGVVSGSVVLVEPPEEIKKYLEKVSAASRKNPEWFREYSAKHASGVPMPFHENMGLTKKEYEDYLKVWDQRKFKVIERVGIKLEERSGNWVIRTSGTAFPISLLKYDPKKDVFKSTNGELVKMPDVNSPKASILKAWKGHEWQFEKKSSLSTLRETLAIGAAADGKYGFLIYRLQEVSSTGRLLVDDSKVIRFVIPKG